MKGIFKDKLHRQKISSQVESMEIPENLITAKIKSFQQRAGKSDQIRPSIGQALRIAVRFAQMFDFDGYMKG
jgi:hypothetical protein